MENKFVMHNEDARRSIKDGIDALANAVKSTLGPGGRTVAIAKYGPTGKPHVTKDGVTVAKNIHFYEEEMDLGASLLREAALKTVETVGDATTSSITLAQRMVSLAEKGLSKGLNPVKMRKGMEMAKSLVLEAFKNEKRNLNPDDIGKIATISANNDPKIGKIIAEAFDKATVDGVVLVEESNNLNDNLNVVKGMQFDSGLIKLHFATDQTKGECILENPVILLTERKINSMMQIKDLLEQLVVNKKPILLIAEDFDSSVIENLAMNKLQGILNVCPIKAPSFGDYRRELLIDIAILTGGKVLTYESGLEVGDISYDMLGTCDKVIVTKDNTTIVNNNPNNEAIMERVNQLRVQLDDEKTKDEMKSDFVIKFIKTRIARLIGGIARVYIGGATEVEMKERKDRADDAICAVRAAFEEGITAGGGVTYLKAKYSIPVPEDTLQYNGRDFQYGYELVMKSLSVIAEQILENCGEPKDLIRKFDLARNVGYDGVNNRLVDMYRSRIIDPAKAVRLAFENAFSVAIMYLSTNCIIIPDNRYV